MADAYGVNYTKYNSGGISNLVTKAWGGEVQAIVDNYTSPTGDLAHTSTIYMGRVPKGARVIGFLFTCGGEGSTAATGGILLGAVAQTAVNALTSMASASALDFNAINATVRTPLTADTDVKILLQGTNKLDATTTLSLTTFFVMDN